MNWKWIPPTLCPVSYSKTGLVSTAWDRLYFFTQGGNLMCQPRGAVAGGMVLDLDNSSVMAIECEDRRYCFQITSPSGKTYVCVCAHKNWLIPRVQMKVSSAAEVCPRVGFPSLTSHWAIFHPSDQRGGGNDKITFSLAASFKRHSLHTHQRACLQQSCWSTRQPNSSPKYLFKWRTCSNWRVADEIAKISFFWDFCQPHDIWACEK